MEIMKFSYTKESGKVSDRVFIPINKPTDLYFGIDISEITETQQGEFAAKLNQIHNQYLAALEGVRAEFDLIHNLRNFKPERMTNIEREFV